MACILPHFYWSSLCKGVPDSPSEWPFSLLPLNYSLAHVPHSHKQSAHWAVDVTAQVVPCWLGSWLNRNFWLVLGQRAQLAIQFIQLDITWVHCLYVADSGNTQMSGWKISWVTCIRTPVSSLHLISPLNCISTETWVRRWYTVG